MSVIPATWKVDIRASQFKVSLGNLVRAYLKTSQAWWHMPLVTATQETEERGLQSEACVRQSVKH
jgi:hypothetical protein